jgi:antitoxin (DNA-binding transcriptional repressor) of toxin-antitoxin stability system
MLATRIIPITDFRRNFGENTDDILSVESYILTKGGRPFAVVKAAPELRRENLKMAMGAWKNTELDDDELWKDVLKRNSRKKDWFK